MITDLQYYISNESWQHKRASSSYFTLEIIGMRTKSDMLAELDRLERLRAAGNAAIDAAITGDSLLA